jgi:hypothetical protein
MSAPVAANESTVVSELPTEASVPEGEGEAAEHEQGDFEHPEVPDAPPTAAMSALDAYFRANNSGYPLQGVSAEQVRQKRWHAAYSDFVRKELRTGAFPHLSNISQEAIAPLCPNYSRLDPTEKEDFWVAYFMSLAHAETDFNVSTGPKTGLMQLTCDATAKVSYDCKCTSKTHLKNNPFVNIDCSMKIINWWSRKRKQITGSHPYFESLRGNEARHKQAFLPPIRKYRPADCAPGYTPPRGGVQYIPTRHADGTYVK